MTTTAAVKLAIGARTDVGAVRARNEDAILAEPPDSPDASTHGWFGMVADGLGGRPSGDVASQLAVRSTRDAFYQPSPNTRNTRERLRSAVHKANDLIIRSAKQVAQHAEMASTATAAVIEGPRLVMAQVGDSRGYLIRNNRLRQITRDHSIVDDLLRKGELTPEEALHHPQRNVITRALGTESTVDVDMVEERLSDADVVLLCSDGLYRMVSDADIARALIGNPQQAAESLVSLANDRGGPDNISVIIVRVSLAEDTETTLIGHL